MLQEESRLISSGGAPGTLTLTSMRLVFGARRGGGLLGGSSAVTAVNLELERIWNLHANLARIDLPGLSRHVLTVESSLGDHSFGVSDPNRWAQSIGEVRSARPSPPPPPPAPAFLPPPPPPPPGYAPGAGSAASVVVQVMAPAAVPTAPTVMIRCRYCGALSAPTSSKCASCGATI